MLFAMAMESLSQRGKSPLYTDLVNLCQEVQDKLRDAVNASNADINLAIKSAGFGERLKAIVFKHMGLKLAGVVIEESTAPNAAARVVMTDKALIDLKYKTVTHGMILEKINRYYDDRSGTYDSTKSVNFPDVILTMRVATGFWRIRNDDGSYLFSSGEIAAVLLHELGHFDHTIRTWDRAQSRLIDAADIINYSTKSPDRDTILLIINKLKADAKFYATWRSILNPVETYFKESNAMDDSYYYEALSSMLTAMQAQASETLLKDLVPLLSNDNERLSSPARWVDSERSADDFASRHGAYSNLVSFFKKLKLGKIYANVPSPSLTYVVSTIPGVVVGLMRMFVTKIRNPAPFFSTGYDPIIRRLELMLQTAKHAFSDNTLPESVKVDMRKQIFECEKYIEEYKRSDHHKARSKLAQWMSTVSKVKRVLFSPVSSRLASDYGRLQDANRDLSRNPLHYHADRLRSK